MSLPSIPNIPLDIDPTIREILEPMKESIDYMNSNIQIDDLPTADPQINGKLWIDDNTLKVSRG